MSDLHVLCKIADAEYVVPAADVLQMESFAGATQVPGAAGEVAGLVQIRGQRRAGARPAGGVRVVRRSSPPWTRASIVMKQGERTVGLLVDSAREVLKIPRRGFPAAAAGGRAADRRVRQGRRRRRATAC